MVLFLHGFMGSCEDFRAVADLLAADFCCLLIDLPGHGKTEVSSDADYLMPAVARGIIELLTELEIEQCFLVGYSMGGRLALYLTLHFPQYFIKVALESASPGLATKLARENRLQQDLKLAQSLKTGDFAVFLQQWYANPLFASFRQHPHYATAIARRLENNPHNLAISLRYMGLGVQPTLWDKLEENTISLLLIVGGGDRKFRAINQKMANLAPNSSLKVVKNTDHNVHFGQPIIFAQILSKFWQ